MIEALLLKKLEEELLSEIGVDFGLSDYRGAVGVEMKWSYSRVPRDQTEEPVPQSFDVLLNTDSCPVNIGHCTPAWVGASRSVSPRETGVTVRLLSAVNLLRSD